MTAPGVTMTDGRDGAPWSPAPSVPAPREMLAALLWRLYAFGRWRLLAFAVLAAAGAVAEGAGLVLLLPLLRAFGLAGQADGTDGLGLAAVLVLYVLLVVGGAVVVRQRMVVGARLRQAFIDDQRVGLHRAVLGLDWAAFQCLRASDLTQALTADTGRTGLAIDMVATLVTTAVTMAAALVVAASLSPWLVAAALALGLAAGLLSRTLSRRSASLGQAQVRTGRETQGALADTLAGLRLVKGLRAEAARADRFEELLAEQARLALAFQRDVATRMVVHRGLAAAGIALGLGVAVRGFGLAPSAAVVFLLAFARLLQTGLRSDQSWRTLVNMLPAFDSVDRLRRWCAAHAEPAEALAVSATPAPRLGRDLVLEGLSFHHPGAARPALDGVDARLPAGTTTAVVGPSGAGKSTLADILLGLLVPTAGVVRVDGAPLTAADRVAWRASVGYVPQDAFLFHDTIRANLLMARPDADEAALWHVLEQAAVANVVRALPQGLDHVVGDRGGRLSGGERQRLALARALLGRPALLVLDEPTSALDGANQALVLETLANLRGGLTIVIVTHREEALGGADQIIRLEAGRRVE